MPCIKTGCHIYSTEYGEFAYGDAFKVGDLYVFRLNNDGQRYFVPIVNELHFEVKRIEQWFDRDRDSRTSTLVATDVIDHGYDGIAIPEGLPR